MKTYLGIDLTSSLRLPSAYAVLAERAYLIEVGSVASDEDMLALAQSWRPRAVAIDAPLALPSGMCCLEATCPCQPLAPDGLRAAERELSRRGIGLFRTTKRSIIKPMVYRGMALRQELESRGFSVLEVYPYASKLSLFGRPLPRKTTAAGRAYFRQRLEGLIDGLATHTGRLEHDEQDALLAAYTAYLRDVGLAEDVGTVDEGVTCIPAQL